MLNKIFRVFGIILFTLLIFGIPISATYLACTIGDVEVTRFMIVLSGLEFTSVCGFLYLVSNSE